MKLLLTSGGFKNQSIIAEAKRLAGRDLKSLKVVYVATAANVEVGDKSWLISNLVELTEIFAEVDIADLALPKDCWQPRLEAADVIVVGGGKTTYLMSQVRSSGLAKKLPEYLKTKLYIGISAGSMIATPTTAPNSDNEPKIEALSFVRFGIQPHYKEVYFSLADTKEKVESRKQKDDIDYPLYALDDQSAVSVDEDKVSVVSEGSWDLL